MTPSCTIGRVLMVSTCAARLWRLDALCCGACASDTVRKMYSV